MKYARPESMGYIHKLSDVSAPKGFLSEYKYNGWAVGISEDKIETRHGKPLPPSYQSAVQHNVQLVREMIDWDFCSMIHAELMCLTPNACPKDTIIVHDCMGGFSAECDHFDRVSLMWLGLPPAVFHAGTLLKPIGPWDERGKIYRPKRVKYYDQDGVWYSPSHDHALKEQLRFNAHSNHLFYEGFIHKKVSARYGAKNAWFKQRIQNQKLTYNKEEQYV